MTIEISQPTAQYTPGSDCACVQFQWRIAAAGDPARGGTPAGAWHRENYSPTQVQLSARADASIVAVAPGYWGDAEVCADVLAWLAAQYGFTDAAFLGGVL